MSEPRVQWVQAQPVTPEAFRPYGQVIAVGAVSTIALQPEELSLDVIHYERRVFRIDHLNRHHRASQSLVPLDRKPCCIVVGRPDLDMTEPEHLEQLEAFLLDGSVGINLAIGTWHEGPWPLMQSVDLVNLQGRHVVASDNEVAHITRDHGVVVRICL